MRAKHIIGTALVLALLGATPLTLAAGGGPAPGPGMPGGIEHHRGMMGQGMMGPGMMGCPMMGGGMMSGGMPGGMMPGGMMGRGMGMMALPPGNEKLQLQMQAEIMQKVGEILAKYAAQIQQRP